MLSEVSSNSTKINRLMNIRSKYILKQILDNLQIHITLNIIRYNKNLQNKLNIDINNYKDCLNIEIEIDVSPEHNGKYIELDDSFYKIEKIKCEENTENEKIKIIINHNIKSLRRIFAYKRIVKVKFLKC